MRYKICRNIPLPKKASYKSRFDDIPIENLRTGDSIFLENITNATISKAIGKQSIYRVGITASARRKNLCGNFKVGIYYRGKTKQLRVWKIS